MKISRTEAGVPENQVFLTDPTSDRIDYINNAKDLLGKNSTANCLSKVNP